MSDEDREAKELKAQQNREKAINILSDYVYEPRNVTIAEFNVTLSWKDDQNRNFGCPISFLDKGFENKLNKGIEMMKKKDLMQIRDSNDSFISHTTHTEPF